MRRGWRTRLAVLALPALLGVSIAAQAGVILQPTPAPEWRVSEWIHGDPGTLQSLSGKIVVIEFFQLWCPGCNEFSIPLIKRWHERYADNPDVVLVSIHTVFEGHDEQSPDRLRRFVLEQGMTQPVGIDAYAKRGDEEPVTMQRFQTEGTPQVVIVDRQRMLRFSHFGRFDPVPVEAFIERLLKEKPSKASSSSKNRESSSERSEPKKRRRSKRR